jgi:hypothetical protein
MRKSINEMGASENGFVLVYKGGTRRVGAIQTLHIYNVYKTSLPKDITRVISKVRDRLVEIGSNRLLSQC